MTPSDNNATDSLVKEQLTLLIEQELRYQLDDILQRMQTLAANFDIGKKGDRRSPLRNLLITATDRTASIEVIKNYIDYQAARSEDVSKVLKLDYRGEKFGTALIKALDDLKLDAEQILNNIITRLPEHHPLVAYLTPTLPTRELIDLHLKLAQLYLGYLMREHTALR